MYANSTVNVIVATQRLLEVLLESSPRLISSPGSLTQFLQHAVFRSSEPANRQGDNPLAPPSWTVHPRGHDDCIEAAAFPSSQPMVCQQYHGLRRVIGCDPQQANRVCLASERPWRTFGNLLPKRCSKVGLQRFCDVVRSVDVNENLLCLVCLGRLLGNRHAWNKMRAVTKGQCSLGLHVRTRNPTFAM